MIQCTGTEVELLEYMYMYMFSGLVDIQGLYIDTLTWRRYTRYRDDIQDRRV